MVGCCEDLWQDAGGLRWVGDAVVKDDDDAGGEILLGAECWALPENDREGGCHGWSVLSHRPW